MRILNVNGQFPVTSRIFRPWVLASVGGLSIGCALLNITNSERIGSYPDMAARAAVYDSTRANRNYWHMSDSDNQSDLPIPFETLFPAEETGAFSSSIQSNPESTDTSTTSPDTSTP